MIDLPTTGEAGRIDKQFLQKKKDKTDRLKLMRVLHDEANKDFVGEPSFIGEPVKRKRGRPKGSKTKKLLFQRD